MSKEKKFVFSETIDSAINGYALGVSFLAIGVFLLLKPDYFFSPIVSYIVGAVIGVIGFFGTGIELSNSSKIKGMDNLTFGVVLLAIWVVTYLKISTIWANIVFFFFLVSGAYAVCLGLIQGVYSILNNIKLSKLNAEDTDGIGKIISQVILFLTQICGLAVAVFNVIKVVSM